MITTTRDVDTVLALFEEQEPGQFWRFGRFIELGATVHLHMAQGGLSGSLAAAVNRVNGDHGTLLTILERSQWQKEMAQRGSLDQTAWFYFAGLDVEHWFIALRSMFDAISGVIRAESNRPGVVPGKFGDLQTWCSEHPELARGVIGDAFTALMTECRWFSPVRSIRDGIVHLGALSIAFPSFETVSFSIHVNGQRIHVPEQLMTNENIADFELYIAWTLGNVELILERVAELILPRFTGPTTIGSRSFRTGFGTSVGYLVRLRECLRLLEAVPAVEADT